MAREQILSESINLSTMELWNSSQITFAISTCLLDIPRSVENASVLTESAAPSDLYFSALTINLLTYLLYKRSNSNNTSFHAKTSRCIENYCIKHRKPRLQGALPPDPHRGLCPWTPAGGSAPRPPL